MNVDFIECVSVTCKNKSNSPRPFTFWYPLAKHRIHRRKYNTLKTKREYFQIVACKTVMFKYILQFLLIVQFGYTFLFESGFLRNKTYMIIFVCFAKIFY